MRGILITVSTLATIVGTIACGPTANPGNASAGADGGPDIRLPPRSSANYDCKDIPEEGQCRDDVALFCDKRSSSIVTKRCGARGLTCKMGDEKALCVNGSGEEQDVPAETTDAPEPGAKDCLDYDWDGDPWVGQCEGNTFRYCRLDQTVYEANCDDINATCGFNDTAGYFACLPTGCGDVTNTDKCEGNAIKTCTISADGYEPELFPCDDTEECVVDSEGYGDCVDKTQPFKCSDVNGLKGICKGDELHFCLNEDDTEPTIWDCTTTFGNQVCEPPSAENDNYADCVDP